MVPDLKIHCSGGSIQGHHDLLKNKKPFSQKRFFEKYSAKLKSKREGTRNHLSMLGRVLTPPRLYVQGSTSYVQDGYVDLPTPLKVWWQMLPRLLFFKN
jgi:hypothetical protein